MGHHSDRAGEREWHIQSHSSGLSRRHALLVTASNSGNGRVDIGMIIDGKEADCGEIGGTFQGSTSPNGGRFGRATHSGVATDSPGLAKKHLVVKTSHPSCPMDEKSQCSPQPGLRLLPKSTTKTLVYAKETITCGQGLAFFWSTGFTLGCRYTAIFGSVSAKVRGRCIDSFVV